MTIENFNFNPPNGLKDATYSPTTPQSESDARTQVQGISDQLKDFINDTLIPALASFVNGSSGADNIGISTIEDLTGNTVQSILEDLRNKLKAVNDGSSGADFINATLIDGLAGTNIQTILESLKKYIDDNFETQDDLTNNRKLSAAGDFTGSWFGIKEPTYADPGIADIVASHTSQLNDIAYNISQFSRIVPEANDRGRIDRAVSAMPEGATLLFPLGTYDLGSAYVFSKRIKVKGEMKPLYDGSTLVGGTIFNDKIHINANGFEIDNIGVLSATADNGFEISTYTASHVKITNCVAKTVSHGFLFESYNSTVDDILVENCESYDSTHGFISKAKSVKFVKCRAFNHASNGFGFISDNIPSATQKAICINNQAIGCYAESCYNGFTAYCRDYFSTNNANSIIHKKLQANSCLANNCNNGYVLGDGGTAPSGQTYNFVEDEIFVNCSQTGSGNSYLLTRIKNSSINGNVEGTYTVDGNTAKVKIDITSPNARISSAGDIATLGTGTSPTINSVSKFYKTANTGATTTLFFIYGGVENYEITILINDIYTVIDKSANFILTQRYSGIGSWVTLKLQNGHWYEVCGYCASKGTVQRKLDVDNSAIDLNLGSAFDVCSSGTGVTTTNKISVTNRPINSETITFIIRSAGGTFTYGGFDTTNFVVPSSFPTSVNFGTAHISSWVYLNAINKWVCINDYTAPYV